MDEIARFEKALKVAERYFKKIVGGGMGPGDRGCLTLPRPALYELYAQRALNEIELIMSVEEVGDDTFTR